MTDVDRPTRILMQKFGREDLECASGGPKRQDHSHRALNQQLEDRVEMPAAAHRPMIIVRA